MLGMSEKDTWMVALLGLSGAAFLAAARWPGRLTEGRAAMIYSVGFSLGFVLLALLSGLSVLR